MWKIIRSYEVGSYFGNENFFAIASIKPENLGNGVIVIMESIQNETIKRWFLSCVKWVQEYRE